jgi:dienelactone hydrolase
MPVWRNVLAGALGVAVCGGALLAGISVGFVRVPLVRTPPPSGRWPIGTVTLDVPVAGAPGGRVSVQAWYPAPAGAGGGRAPYLYHARRALRVAVLSAVVTTDAVPDAPVAASRFPTIVLVPGWGGRRENNTAQAQDLASNGYIVVAFSDPYPEPPLDFTSEGARARTIDWADRKLKREARDVTELLDALGALDRSSSGRFSGRLDTGRIGILGFSFGGAVAAELARSDARVRAAVNLDGWLFGDALHAGVPRPFMTVSAPLVSTSAPPERYASEAARIEGSFDRANELDQLAGLRRNGGFLVTIAGTGHYDFTDAAWLPSLRHTGVGPIEGRRATLIVATYVRQFFDRYLKDRRAPLFDGSVSLDDDAHLVAF